jgi:hypothetical protein
MRMVIRFVLIIFFLIPFNLKGQWVDWDWEKKDIAYNGNYELYNQAKVDLGTVSLINRYQNTTVAKETHSCPMFPSCSTYAKYSILKYGLLQGLVMIVDRLYIRESALLKTSTKEWYIKVNDIENFNIGKQGSYYDIPEANNIFDNDKIYYDPSNYSKLWKDFHIREK